MSQNDHQEKPKVGDFIAERLRAWGVTRVYGYAGDGINGIIGGIQRAGNRPRFIQPPHEELAAFMACAHAKYTGEVGVCLGTSGPGAIHLLNGLYDAVLDHQPVVAIVGQQSQMAIGSRYQQDVDLQSLFKDVAGAFVQTAMDPAQVRHLIDRAFRTARAERSVTCVIVPNDLQRQEAVPEPPHAHGVARRRRPDRAVDLEQRRGARRVRLRHGRRDCDEPRERQQMPYPRHLAA
jgi:pyruvate dehydrogenase (quinone)